MTQGDCSATPWPTARRWLRLVERYVTQALLDEIAAEYAKGRLLLVGTTNLDALEPVIWNMTAIAASKDPRALACSGASCWRRPQSRAPSRR